MPAVIHAYRPAPRFAHTGIRGIADAVGPALRCIHQGASDLVQTEFTTFVALSRVCGPYQRAEHDETQDLLFQDFRPCGTPIPFGLLSSLAGQNARLGR
jgi:hypothetical protein